LAAQFARLATQSSDLAIRVADLIAESLREITLLQSVAFTFFGAERFLAYGWTPHYQLSRFLRRVKPSFFSNRPSNLTCKGFSVGQGRFILHHFNDTSQNNQ
jgi:hypothetical protein